MSLIGLYEHNITSRMKKVIYNEFDRLFSKILFLIVSQMFKSVLFFLLANMREILLSSQFLWFKWSDFTPLALVGVGRENMSPS